MAKLTEKKLRGFTLLSPLIKVELGLQSDPLFSFIAQSLFEIKCKVRVDRSLTIYDFINLPMSIT
jgi:hypothetical protein